MTNDQRTRDDLGHWCLVICWSLGFGHWGFLRPARLRRRRRALLLMPRLQDLLLFLRLEARAPLVSAVGPLLFEPLDRVERRDTAGAKRQPDADGLVVA